MCVPKAVITALDVSPGFSNYTGKKLIETSEITVATVSDSGGITDGASFALNL
jgi:hypothetical protein